MLRSLLGFLVAGTILGMPAASGAATNPFIGTWQTSAVVSGAGGMKMAVTIQIVFTPQGTYSELDRSYAGATQETGKYLLMANNILRLVVTNWAPSSSVFRRPVAFPYGSRPAARFNTNSPQRRRSSRTT